MQKMFRSKLGKEEIFNTLEFIASSYEKNIYKEVEGPFGCYLCGNTGGKLFLARKIKETRREREAIEVSFHENCAAIYSIVKEPLNRAIKQFRSRTGDYAEYLELFQAAFKVVKISIEEYLSYVEFCNLISNVQN